MLSVVLAEIGLRRTHPYLSNFVSNDFGGAIPYCQSFIINRDVWIDQVRKAVEEKSPIVFGQCIHLEVEVSKR